VDDVLEVPERAGEPVDAGDDQGVASAQEVEQEPHLGPPLARGAAPLLRPDHPAAGGAERGLLDREVLVDR
jgi:hypothetical protein